MEEENLQVNMPPRPSHLVPISVSVLITALVVGSGIYWWQDAKFQKEINELKNTIEAPDQQVISLGEIPKVDKTNTEGASNKEKISGDYQWDDMGLKSQYSDAYWNKIATHKLSGFLPKISLIEKSTEGCGGWTNGSNLRIEGGLCSVGYWLEESNGARIDSKEKLVSRFAPVENEAEAISFVSVTQGDLRIDTSGIPTGHTLSTSEGFLVHLVYQNTFGCGTHEPTGVIFRISRKGEFSTVAYEKPKSPKPGEPILCVD